jgi:hypothetical protein
MILDHGDDTVSGTLGLTSLSDKRWNQSWLVFADVFTAELAAREKIGELRKSLGDPPHDLRMSFMKD